MRRSVVTAVALALLCARTSAAEEHVPKKDLSRDLNLAAVETSELIREGDKYRTGDGAKKDLVKAEAAYTEALRRGNSKGGLGLYLLALAHSGKGNTPKNLPTTKRLFDIYFPLLSGPRFVEDPIACLTLGLTYFDGLGGRVDYRKAATFLLRYAESIKSGPDEVAFRSIVAEHLILLARIFTTEKAPT